MNERRSHPASLAPADNAQAAHGAFAAVDIHRQLHRILGSTELRHSLRLTRFLTFVVEATLAGKSDRIKAYTVAVEALGRGDDFDPQRDPIVRVEAGRLRKALAHYYAEAGRDDALVIDMPRGTYVPVFRLGGAKEAALPKDDLPPITDAIRRPAPPLIPTAPSVSPDAGRPGEGEKIEETRELQRQIERPRAVSIKNGMRALIAAAKDHMGRYARIFRIGIYIVGFFSVLGVAFHIGRPLTGGDNSGLLFKLWVLQGPRAP